MIQIKINDNEIKNKINQIKNNKKLIINKIASILEAETIRLEVVCDLLCGRRSLPKHKIFIL
jgi:hypothetical protein